MFSNFIEPNNNVVSDTEIIYKYSNSSVTIQNISDLLDSFSGYFVYSNSNNSIKLVNNTNNNLLLPQQPTSNLVLNNNENIAINTNNVIISDEINEILEEDINEIEEESINKLLTIHDSFDNNILRLNNHACKIPINWIFNNSGQIFILNKNSSLFNVTPINTVCVALIKFVDNDFPILSKKIENIPLNINHFNLIFSVRKKYSCNCPILTIKINHDVVYSNIIRNEDYWINKDIEVFNNSSTINIEFILSNKYARKTPCILLDNIQINYI
jgi:hypothetical protein